ncbi:hypothetical protein RRG08_035623 [Elysia crispata]|uniref:Uncharacterized protein n=1 Tax=Elysia crispata TaxID=231223 RepID=A0AAE0Z721_9GAST|nr:hypothetical protein RRG08_035623 [Elysia crispata]
MSVTIPFVKTHLENLDLSNVLVIPTWLRHSLIMLGSTSFFLKVKGSCQVTNMAFGRFDSPLNLFAYSVLSKDYLRMDLSKPPLHIRKTGLCFSPQEKERPMLIVGKKNAK